VTAVATTFPAALLHCIAGLLGGPDDAWRLAGHERLKPHVHRLRFQVDGRTRSFVVKRSLPDVARRNRLVATQWLPAEGLETHGPGLLALAEDRAARRVWHVYEDLGPHMLDAKATVRAHVEATVAVVARLHTAFAGHRILPDCRAQGDDLGMAFYSANVRRGIEALAALQPGDGVPGRALALRDRLLERLLRLEDETAARAAAHAALGVPETLLHGDLWTVNVMIVPDVSGLRVRLIDWDHAGAGPVTYDVSTFLLRLPPQHRRWIFGAYRRETARLAGWRLPPDEELEMLFETAELARYSSVVPGAVNALRSDHAEWALDRLASIDAWFKAYEPVLARSP
jgi:hypothetical protein